MNTLLVALLLGSGQRVMYVPGLTVNRAASSYRGAGKTDARDAHVIADQAHMRRDLTVLRGDEELIAELRMLVARRQDLVSRLSLGPLGATHITADRNVRDSGARVVRPYPHAHASYCC